MVTKKEKNETTYNSKQHQVLPGIHFKRLTMPYNLLHNILKQIKKQL